MPGLKVTVSNTLAIVGTNFAQHKLELTNSESVIACGDLRVRGATLSLGAPDRPFYYPNDNYWDERHQIVEGPTLTCSGDLVLTNAGLAGARLLVHAGLAHAGTDPEYGAQVTVGGDILTYSNCWIHPVAHPTNGTVPLFSMNNLKISRYGGFDANAWGFASGRVSGQETNIWNRPYGPGISTNTSVNHASANAGSSYGGMGTRGYYGYPAPVYGSAEAPILPGSGARSGWASGGSAGPWGGGSVQIRADNAVELTGTIRADGGNGAITYGPPASGGAIYIRCLTFAGNTNGMLSANGGDAAPSGATIPFDGGGAGGGRIAVWRMNDLSTGAVAVTVNGGLGGHFTTNLTGQWGSFATGDPGTIVWGQLPVAGTVIRFR